MELRERCCPICGAESSTVHRESRFDPARIDRFSFASRKSPELMHFRLLLCTECDLIYASPAPSLDWFESGYEGADFDADRESVLAARTYARCLDRFIDTLPSREGALDIGAGDGAFLRELDRRGFLQVVGVEPSVTPFQRAAADIRDSLRNEFFDAARFEPASLSLVSCFQTLEHLEDPAGLCRDAHRLLAPGGLFFAVVHDHRALSARVLGDRSPIYDIEHLQLFSRQALRGLLGGAGFESVEIGSLTNAYPLSYWLRLLPIGRRARRFSGSTLRWLGLDRAVVPLRAGNLYCIGMKTT